MTEPFVVTESDGTMHRYYEPGMHTRAHDNWLAVLDDQNNEIAIFFEPRSVIKIR